LLVLLCGTEIAQSEEDLFLLVPDRAVIRPIPLLDRQATGERGADRMAGLFEDEHRETGKDVIEQAVPWRMELGEVFPRIIEDETAFRDHREVGFVGSPIPDRLHHTGESPVRARQEEVVVRIDHLPEEIRCSDFPVTGRKAVDFVSHSPHDDLQIEEGERGDLLCHTYPGLTAGLRGRYLLAGAANLVTNS